MRLRLLAIWVSLALLLQWSRAQEDNIQEVSITGGSEGESSDKNEDHPAKTEESGDESPGGKQPLLNTTELPADDKEPVGGETSSQAMPTDDSQGGEMGHQSGEDKDKPGEVSVDTNSEVDHKVEETDETQSEKESTDTSPPPDHQSGEDEKKPDEVNMDTNSEVDHKVEETEEIQSEKEGTDTSPSPETPEAEKDDQPSDHLDPSPTITQGSSSEVEPNILNRPPTSPEEGTHFANETSVVSSGGSPDYPNDGPHEDTTPQPTAGTTLSPPTPPIPIPVFPPLTCYSCMVCNKTAVNETQSKCPPIPGKQNGCRTILVKDPFIVPGKRNYLSRGCESDLDTLSRYCEDNEQLCPTCYESNCNNHNMTQFEETSGSAAATSQLLTLSPFLIWSICLFSWQVRY
ncbi:proteoglycan 4 [Drosophila biarmipes]|uniref:proteoglycan 4 n=1 Tax=Drosophila biarmipes TaxID=125945 RepID=UPI0007E7BB7E|nr:proteoglycan 4 [Drosophila biarmipes]